MRIIFTSLVVRVRICSLLIKYAESNNNYKFKFFFLIRSADLNNPLITLSKQINKKTKTNIFIVRIEHKVDALFILMYIYSFIGYFSAHSLKISLVVSYMFL